jgi:hypothetical protein
MSQKVVTTKYLAKFQSPRVTTRPKNHLPKEKVTWKFSPTENRFGFSTKIYTVLEQKLLEIYTGISFVCPSH